ncbi:MAG: FG-GAP repeat protein, partial [Planctomycetes bacterium]|nr:FG-GAP repeat protein [Planctomycetota bacterium]
SAYLFDTTTGRQIDKLLAEDGAAFDYFGFSVAISDITAIVGAIYDDDNGILSGSAYLFDTTTGRQLFKLLPEDGAAFDRFGISVGISGATAIVGAYGADPNGAPSRSAYLFDTATGRQIAKLLPNDDAGAGSFGRSVAISGATAIVGAISGSAYLFDTTTGEQIDRLLPNDGAAGDHFGTSVGLSGTTAIVGAPRHDDYGPWSGSAYLFDTTTGRQVAKLLRNDGAAKDSFGWSVAISGAPGKETAIVGAYEDDDNGTNSGSAYLFDASSCPWDLDDNAVVGVPDLLALLGSWGPCPPKGDCPADFDNSNDVGVKDLLILLGNWGPCP